MPEIIFDLPADENETELVAALRAALGGIGTGEFGKALKVGGPAHMNLNARQIARIQNTAPKRAGQLRDAYANELWAIVDGFTSAVILANAARSTLGAKADEHLAKIRRSTLFAARRVIRENYRAQWRAGRDAGGNLTARDTAETKLLTKMYRAQQAFFENMLGDIEDGTAKMPLPQRVQLYANASREAFGAGLVFSDLSPDVYYRWIPNAHAESCGDCMMLWGGGRWADTIFAGTYSASELAHMGVFPGCGQLECCTCCKCELERCARPNAAPRGELWHRVVLGKNQSNVRENIHSRLLRHRWNFKGRNLRI